MRILVCGGRNFKDRELMLNHLNFDRDDTVTLIHGDASGADKLSEEVLTGYFKGGFEILRFPADWKKYGKKAGFIRNQQMLNEGKPDMVIAFPGGKGTEMMIKLAQLRNIPVRQILGKDCYYES